MAAGLDWTERKELMMAKRATPVIPKACKNACGRLAIRNELYCKECRKAILSELKSSGYLEDVPFNTGTFSEERGRARTVDLDALGGCAEMNSDGDDW